MHPKKRGSPEPAHNDGARRLAKWLKDKEITQTTLGGLLGIHQGHVSKFVRGVRVPRAALQMRIRTITRGAVYWDKAVIQRYRAEVRHGER